MDTSGVYDVLIVGGGPAGSAMGSYLALAGLKVIILEKEHFPRPHVGESLVPASNRVLQEIGVFDKVEQAGFIVKYGATWTTHSNPQAYSHDFDGVADASIRFYENQESIKTNYTFHVDRGKFDKLLLDHARENGATVIEGAKVESIDFHLQEVSAAYTHNSNVSTIKASMVVDASGRNTLLGRQLGFYVKDPVYNQCALHSWFKDFARGNDSDNDNIFVHFLPTSNTWIWQIPITENITSLGIVTQGKHFPKSRDEWETFFYEQAKTRPELYSKLLKAEIIRPFKAEGDYSYRMKHFAGNRFVLVGDAARFVDPIFSSGVSIALNGARFASYDIIKAFEKNDFSHSSFNQYEAILNRGSNNWYEFISLYYRLNILFTYFVNHKDYRADILKLLQGNVYDEQEPEVLGKMRDMVTAVEQNKNHVWHHLLGTLTADTFNPKI